MPPTTINKLGLRTYPLGGWALKNQDIKNAVYT